MAIVLIYLGSLVTKNKMDLMIEFGQSGSLFSVTFPPLGETSFQRAKMFLLYSSIVYPCETWIIVKQQRNELADAMDVMSLLDGGPF